MVCFEMRADLQRKLVVLLSFFVKSTKKRQHEIMSRVQKDKTITFLDVIITFVVFELKSKSINKDALWNL